MIRELRDGLVLRSLSEGYASDREDLPAFFVEVFKEEGDSDADNLGHWAHDLIDGHPTVTPDDIWVVINPAQDDRIVSALLLIPQMWRYEDIDFGFGRVELVATHKDFRGRGLIRELIDAAHERSESLGHLVQGITGIPHYYRQFGYTMAVHLGARSVVPYDAIPPLPEDKAPKFTLRDAALHDIYDLADLDIYASTQSLLSAIRTPELWNYELSGRRDESAQQLRVQMIVNTEGESVGYILLGKAARGNKLLCFNYVVGEKSSYLETFNDVIRGIAQLSKIHYPEEPPIYVAFDSVPQVVDDIVERTFTASNWPFHYSWYLRVPDLAAMIHRIAPVLERRLVGSGANRYSGIVRIGFFSKHMLEIEFERGRIVRAENKRSGEEPLHGNFPWHFFLNMLFGYHTYPELRHVLPDVSISREVNVLFGILFPRKRSRVYSLG